MNFRLLTGTLFAGLVSGAAPAQTVDMTGYRALPGLVAVSEGGSLTLTWDGEEGQELHARFSVVDGTLRSENWGCEGRAVSGGHWA